MTEQMRAYDLTEQWVFKQSDTEEWMPVAKIPTNVHLDLMANRK
jgi:beta-mannosidase